MFDAAPAQLVPAKNPALARIPARIYTGEFQPGVKLSIDGLATEPGCRTPIRDAFGQLEREGLVTITSRVGSSAALPVQGGGHLPDEEAIEPLMARWAAERPSAAQRADPLRHSPGPDHPNPPGPQPSNPRPCRTAWGRRPTVCEALHQRLAEALHEPQAVAVL